MEELTGVGKEGTRLGEHLRISRPTQALITLRTVRRHGEIVGPLAPKGICDESVDRWVARRDRTDLYLLGDRGDGNGLERFNAHLIRRRDGDEAVAIEGTCRMVSDIVFAARKSVVEQHTDLRDTQVQAVATALGSIHTPALGTIAIVEQLSR